MAPRPPPATACFSATLPFRSQGKRKRDRSLPGDTNRTKSAYQPTLPTVEEDADEYFAQNAKSDEDSHANKKRRFNNHDATDINSSFNDLKLRGRTVRRIKAPVSPFIPRKPRGIVKSVVGMAKPRPKPVFGVASLMTAAEEQLVIALKKKGAQVTVVKNLNGLPNVALDPTVDSAERSKEELDAAQVPVYYDKHDLKHNDQGVLVPIGDNKQVQSQGIKYFDQQTMVDSDDQVVTTREECVCGAIAEDTQIQCIGCTRSYHPACVGKGLQDPAFYLDNRRDQAVQEDADFYRKKGGFTCTDCDNEALAAKNQWAPKKLNAEKRRRNKLFSAKNIFQRGETIPRECDSCDQIILNIRFECTFCDYDLCNECFTNPEKSSLHKHSAGGMKIK